MFANETIIYSATALHDFQQCHRRYELKYHQRQPWPAPHAEPLSMYDLQQQRGQVFHRLVERYYLGIDPELLGANIEDDTVHSWWLTFLQQAPAPRDLPGQLSAETRLSTEIQGYRFDVLYDLLHIDPEHRKLTIFDWKTTPRLPKIDERKQAIQTQLYLVVAGQLRHQFLGPDAVFEDIRMVYWFPEHPHSAISITYSSNLHTQYTQVVLDTVTAIEQHYTQPSPWPLTENLRTCQHCVYRSLCERGIQGGEEAEALPEEPEEKDHWAALLEGLLF